jgi:hypothetical protein
MLEILAAADGRIWVSFTMLTMGDLRLGRCSMAICTNPKLNFLHVPLSFLRWSADDCGQNLNPTGCRKPVEVARRQEKAHQKGKVNQRDVS